MTIKSLQDLNTYAQNPITYTDVRTAQVLFDRGATVDQTLTISENSQFNLPYGININDITQYEIADVEYHIDLSFWTDPVNITWDYLPSHVTVTRTNNTWIVSDIRTAADWLYVREAKVLPPFGFSGAANLDAAIHYYSDNQDSTKNQAAWDITLTVTQVQYFTSAPNRTYVSNVVYSNFSTTSIATDPQDFDPVWDLRVFSADALTLVPVDALEEITSDGSPGEATWNTVSKQFVIAGDTESINAVLSTLDVETKKYSADFVLVFRLANNFTSDLEFQIQNFASRDFISDQAMVATQVTAPNYIFGGTLAVSVTATSSTTYNLIRDPNPTEFVATASLANTPNAIWRPTSVLNSTFGIVPNGGFLLEGAATINASAGIVPNGGFLREGAATINATASLACSPIQHTDGFVLEFDNDLNSDVVRLGSVSSTNKFNIIFNDDAGNIDTQTGVSDAINTYTTANKLTVVIEKHGNKNIAGTVFNSVIKVGGNKLSRIVRWGGVGVDSYISLVEDSSSLEFIDPLGPSNPAKFIRTFSGLSTSGGASGNTTENLPDITTLDTSTVTSMAGMFNGTNMNQNISGWNTSNCTDMRLMFSSSTFNQNINSWNVGSVTKFQGMFTSNPFFNQSLNSWNTSSATNMSGMFFDAVAFDGVIANWNTSAVTNFSGPLDSTSDPDLVANASEVWNFTAGVYNASEGGMFAGFDSGLNEYDTNSTNSGSYRSNYNSRFGSFPALADRIMSFNQDVSGWNTSSVTTAKGMFYNNIVFNRDLSSWNTSSITDLTSFLHNARAFNYSLDTNTSSNYWVVSSVTTMENMFANAYTFNQSLNNWDTSSVTNMKSMFYCAFNTNVGQPTYLLRGNFNSNIASWTTSAVTDFSIMFHGQEDFNINIGSWNTGAATNMTQMFRLADSFNQNIGSWDTADVTNMDSMFSQADAFDQDISSWCVELISSKPSSFDSGTLSSWTTSEKPDWGTAC